MQSIIQKMLNIHSPPTSKYEKAVHVWHWNAKWTQYRNMVMVINNDLFFFFLFFESAENASPSLTVYGQFSVFWIRHQRIKMSRKQGCRWPHKHTETMIPTAQCPADTQTALCRMNAGGQQSHCAFSVSVCTRRLWKQRLQMVKSQTLKAESVTVLVREQLRAPIIHILKF